MGVVSQKRDYYTCNSYIMVLGDDCPDPEGGALGRGQLLFDNHDVAMV